MLNQAPQLDSARALRDAMRVLIVAHGALDDARRPCGARLPRMHAWALLELHAHGPLSVNRLAERLAIDRTNVSRLCARLVEEGQVTRVWSAEDRRRREIALTEAGRKAAAAVDASSADFFERVRARLGERAGAVEAALQALAEALPDSAEADVTGGAA